MFQAVVPIQPLALLLIPSGVTGVVFPDSSPARWMLRRNVPMPIPLLAVRPKKLNSFHFVSELNPSSNELRYTKAMPIGNGADCIPKVPAEGWKRTSAMLAILVQ